jgi:hypothetical protein
MLPPRPRPISRASVPGHQFQGFSFQGFSFQGSQLATSLSRPAPYGLAPVNAARAVDATGADRATGAALSLNTDAAGTPSAGIDSGAPARSASGTSVRRSSASRPTGTALSANSPATSARVLLTSDKAAQMDSTRCLSSGCNVSSPPLDVGAGYPAKILALEAVPLQVIALSRRDNPRSSPSTAEAIRPRSPRTVSSLRDGSETGCISRARSSQDGAPDGIRTRIFQPPKLALLNPSCFSPLQAPPSSDSDTLESSQNRPRWPE